MFLSFQNFEDQEDGASVHFEDGASVHFLISFFTVPMSLRWTKYCSL